MSDTAEELITKATTILDNVCLPNVKPAIRDQMLPVAGLYLEAADTLLRAEHLTLISGQTGG